MSHEYSNPRGFHDDPAHIEKVLRAHKIPTESNKERSPRKKERNILREFEDSVTKGATTLDHTYPYWGLSGETGEVHELVKKAWRKKGIDWHTVVPKDELFAELGDVAWYLARCCHVMGWSLKEVMIANMKKLEDRRKYGKVPSKNRS